MTVQTIQKGDQATVTTRFSRGVSTPSWSLLDSSSRQIMTGTAAPSTSTPGGWDATFTVPTNAPIANGEEAWEVVFSTADMSGRQLERSIVISVVDPIDEWQSHGLLHLSHLRTLRAAVVLPKPATSIELILRHGYDAPDNTGEIDSTTLTSPTATSVTSRGYAYELALPLTAALTDQSAGIFPYQLIITSNYSSGQPDIEARPVYVMTPTIITHCNSLRRYLDKARLTEIDQNLQWAEDELVHFLYEGMGYVNTAPPQLTYWTVTKCPTALISVMTISAAWQALNARFLAEGMTSFDFQGANTQFSVNRRDAIQTKMDELKGVLDNILAQTKAAAIKTVGPGTPPAIPGVANTTAKKLGVLGIDVGPTTNRSWPYSRSKAPYRY